MGFLKTKTSITRYQIKEYTPLRFSDAEAFSANLKRYSFRELEDTQTRSFGWVDMFDNLNINFEDLFYIKGEFIVLSIRTDTKRVPYSAWASKYRKVIQERKQITGKLSQSERKEIKNAIKEKLLKQALPTTKVVDVIWNLNTGEVLFSSTNENTNIIFVKLFKDTFNYRLEMLVPHQIAERVSCSLKPKDAQKIKDLLPSNFAAVPSYSDVGVISGDMVSTIASKKFIGEEFLTYLWWRSQKINGVFNLPDLMVELYVDDRIILTGDNGGKVSRIVCSGDNVELKEAREALSLGKRVSEIKFKFFIEDQQFTVVMDSSYFKIISCKTPKVSIDKDDMDGAFFEKVALLQKIIFCIEKLYAQFLQLRISDNWERMRKQIQNWAINKEK